MTKDFSSISIPLSSDIPLLNIFQDYVQKGWLSSSIRDNLILFTYTQKCVFERNWDPITRMARGLILDQNTGAIVARPFQKFFNLNEVPETALEKLPLESPEITEKMDGSLGILYWLNGNPRIATKGSFTSEQASWASHFLEQKGIHLLIPQGVTLLFEIIYPENRVVVNYGTRQSLVLLGAIEIQSGREWPYSQLVPLAKTLSLEVVPSHTISLSTLLEILKTLPSDREGFVLRYSSGLRVKFKGDEYLRIHKLISHLNPKTFWEQMSDGKVSPVFLEGIPEEFRVWALSVVQELELAYQEENRRLQQLYQQIPSFPERKDFAAYVIKQYPLESKALFSLLDQREKNLDAMIHQRIKPKPAPIRGEEL
ncbi:MAG: T4 RnlA family RNA ligase [Planctomycetota bacterium]